MAHPPIDGACDSRFGAVREAFASNFAEEDEIGAAVAVCVDGDLVVDLWGGHADAGRKHPWRRDTLVNAYSVGKGILACLVLKLVDAGTLDFDTTIAELWPEFAAEGKAGVTLRTLLSHRAGLPAIRERLPAGAMYDWDAMTSALAGQAPYWAPDTRHGYHVNTFGYLVGEVVRRASGLDVGAALREFVTGPLDCEYYWGVPEHAHDRVAEVCAVDADVTLDTPEAWAAAFPPTGDSERDTMVWHCYFNPCGLSGSGVINTAPWRSASIPSTNGHATARAVSAIYDALLSRDPALRLASRDLVSEATSIASDGVDAILDRPSRFGLGFQLAQPSRPLGPNPETFGHYGYGGTLGFCDPVAGVAFGYVMNRPGQRWQTPRTQSLVDALYESL